MGEDSPSCNPFHQVAVSQYAEHCHAERSEASLRTDTTLFLCMLREILHFVQNDISGCFLNYDTVPRAGESIVEDFGPIFFSQPL